MIITPISQQYVEVDVVAKLANGSDAPVSGVDVALLPPRVSPDADTLWTTAAYALGTATVLVAGPDADGDLVVPRSGADLWMRVVDSPEVTATKITRISVI